MSQVESAVHTEQDTRPWLEHYEPEVAPTLAYPEVALHRLLENTAVRYADRPATVFFSGTLTYRELNDEADRFANGLIRLGLKKGDRVALMLPNCPQFIIAFYGALKAGGVVVPLNPLYTERELEFKLKDSGTEFLVTLTRFYELAEAVRPHTNLKHIIVSNIKEYFSTSVRIMFTLAKEKKDGHRVEVPHSEGTHRFARVVSERTRHPMPEVSPEEVAVLQYTGGTTGTMKAAMLTHRNLVANAVQVRVWDTHSKDGEDIILTVLPLFHVYALTVAMNRGIYAGCMLVLLPRFDLQDTLKAIDKYKPTIFPGVPTLYNALSTAPETAKYDLRSIRSCISGSAGLPRTVQERFESLTGGKLVEGYGLSEASPVTHCNPFYRETRLGSIGVPLPDTDAKVVDLETGTRDLPVGETGELLVRGPQVMAGYWNQPEETAQCLVDGWLHTGDIACQDKDGFFYIVDRKKDMIIVGGFNVYPRDVEEVLYEHPAVAEAVAVGIPDEHSGERVKAFVVLKKGETASQEDIIQFCRKSLAAYKIPKVVEFRDSLPKTVVGKVLRRVLLEEETEKANEP